MMTPEELAREIGYISEIVKGGSLGNSQRHRAGAAAATGMQQPGYSTYYRASMLRHITQAAPELDGEMRQVIAASPTFQQKFEDYQLQQQRQLESDAVCLFENIEEPAQQALKATQPAISAWVADTSHRLINLLRQTQAWQAGKDTDIAYLLTDTDTGVSTSLGMRQRELDRVSMQGLYVGLPSMVASRVSRSVVNRMLRVLLQERPQLSAAIDAMSNNQFGRHAYKLLSEERSNYSLFLRSLKRVTSSHFNARKHALIGPALENIADLRWPRARLDERYPDECTILHQFPAATLGHRRSAAPLDLDVIVFGEHILSVPPQLRSEEEPDEDESLALTRTDDRWIVAENAPYADVDWELLPAGSREVMERTMRGLRTTMHLLLRDQRLASAVRQFPSLTLSRHSLSTVLSVEDDNTEALAAILPHAQRFTTNRDGADRTFFILNSTADEEVSAESEGKSDDAASDAQLGRAMREAFGEMTTFQELDRLLLAVGLDRIDGEGKGSHIKYLNPDSGAAAIVSHRYSKSATADVPVGIVASSLRSARLTTEQLETLREVLLEF